MPESCEYRECGWPDTKVYFVEERRAASVGIHPRMLCERHAQEVVETGVYIEEKQCDCSGFEHFFGRRNLVNTDDRGYGCPGPLPDIFNPCCGASDDKDVKRPCAYGCCVEIYCGGCGVSTHGGWGPVRCPCEKGWSKHWNYPERKKLKTPNGGEYNRRRKARVKRS